MGEINAMLLNVEGLTFPQGLVGIPEWKHFNLRQTPDMNPVALLESMDEKGLSYIVSCPANWLPAYKFTISDEEMAVIKATSIEKLVVLSIINVENDPFSVTANMLSPVVINPDTKLGIQLLLHDSPYQAKQPLTVRTMAVHLDDGLLGIPEWKSFILQVVDELMPVMLLGSKDEGRVSFPVVDPWLVDTEYSPKLSDEDRAFLAPEKDEDLSWLVILNVVNEPFSVTANMMSPIAINPKTGKARQVLLSQSGYQPMQPVKFLNPAAFGKA